MAVTSSSNPSAGAAGAAPALTRTHQTAAVLSVGDELTLGQTLDTNAKWIAQRLTDMGVVPTQHQTVPDDLDAHVAALLRLAREVDVIICTGGLGPTADDLTRLALAQASQDVLVEDPLALAQIESWYAARGRTLTSLNRQQAQRTSRGQSIPNHNGTAPGLYACVEVASGNGTRACDVFCLPGPPRELFPMFEQFVMPRLRLQPGKTVRTRVLHTFGLAESDLAQRLGTLMDRDAFARGQVMVGTTASGGVVSIRARYEGRLSPVEAEAALDAVEAQCRELVGPYIFGDATQTLASVTLAHLRTRRETLGVVESCTGGVLGAMLTDVPGSSAVFAGGLITYTNQLKTQLAHVPAAHFDAVGAVSAEVARAMAVGGLKTLQVDHALAITGIAGPTGATPGKPVGLVWIARASRGEVAGDCRAFQMTGDRTSVREWAARTALAMLWQHVAGLPPMELLRQVRTP